MKIVAKDDSQTKDLRPEIKLLIGCALTHHVDAATAEQVKSLVMQPIDWEDLTQLATKHGILSLLYRNLSTICPQAVPADILRYLEEQFYVTASYNLYLAHALGTLLNSFTEQGIPVIPFKGPTLAVATFGDLTLRHAGDLDIMVQPQDMAKAQELLISEGYSLIPSEGEFALHYLRNDRRVQVDLHWGISSFSSHPITVPQDWWRRLVPLTLVGTTVLHLPPEETLLLLCVNATRHVTRIFLSNLNDILAQVQAHPGLDWSQLIEQARRMRCERMLYTALLLVHDLWGIPFPLKVWHAVMWRFRLRRPVNLLFHSLFRNPAEHSVIEQFLYRFLLAGSRQERFDQLRLILEPSQKDLQTFPLPAALSFLYYFLRPLRLVKSYLADWRLLARLLKN